MSQSITGTTPGFGFLGLAFAATFVAEDFDHDTPVSFAAIGLPAGVTLGTPTSIGPGAVGTSFTVNTGTELLTFGTDHHLQENDVVRVQNSGGGLPAGFSAGVDYYVIADGLTATTCKLSATPGGSAVNLTTAGTGTHTANWIPQNDNGVSLTGAPTAAGIYDIKIVATGLVGGILAAVYYTNTVIVEGGDYLAYYHLDYDDTPPQPRNSIDLQYNVRARTFASVAFDVEDGIELHLGETLRIHAIISRNGTQTLADYTPLLPDPAPTNVALIIRPKQQFDAPPFLHAEAAGAESIGLPGEATRDIPYFDVTIGTRRMERLFAQLNAPSGAEPSSEYLIGEAQLSFTLDGRTHTSPVLPVKIRQTFRR